MSAAATAEDLNFYDMFALNLANALHEKDEVKSFLRAAAPSSTLHWRSPGTDDDDAASNNNNNSAWTLDYLDVDIILSTTTTTTTSPAMKMKIGLFLKKDNGSYCYAKADWGPPQVDELIDSLGLDFEDLDPASSAVASFAQSTAAALRQQPSIGIAPDAAAAQDNNGIDRGIEITLPYKGEVNEMGKFRLLTDSVCQLDSATVTMMAINFRRLDNLQRGAQGKNDKQSSSFDDHEFLQVIQQWRSSAGVSVQGESRPSLLEHQSDGSSSKLLSQQDQLLSQESQSSIKSDDRREQLKFFRQNSSRRKKRKGLAFAK